MKTYHYSEARKRLSELLDTAKKEEVLIKRRGGRDLFLGVQENRSIPLCYSRNHNRSYNCGYSWSD